MGIAQASDLPLSWDDNKNVVWKTALPGSGASSPITYGDHIYLTAYTGYFVSGEPGGSLDQLKRHLIALRRDNGEIIWNEAVPAKLPEEERIRDHGYAANTPAADSDRVYVFLGKTGVFAFDHDGNQLWQADVGSNTHGWGTAASPLLYKDLVIINASVESGVRQDARVPAAGLSPRRPPAQSRTVTKHDGTGRARRSWRLSVARGLSSRPGGR